MWTKVTLSRNNLARHVLHVGSLLSWFFYPEDGSDMFLWNISSLKDYMALYPKDDNFQEKWCWFYYVCFYRQSEHIITKFENNFFL
jgi:hypothetical protein